MYCTLEWRGNKKKNLNLNDNNLNDEVLPINEILLNYYNNINNNDINKGISGLFIHQFNINDIDINKQNNTSCMCCNTLDDSYLNNILCTATANRYKTPQSGVVISWTYWRKDITTYNNNTKELNKQVFTATITPWLTFIILDTTKILNYGLLTNIDINNNLSSEPNITLSKTENNKTSNVASYYSDCSKGFIINTLYPFINQWYINDADTISNGNINGYTKEGIAKNITTFIKGCNNSDGNNEIITNTWNASSDIINYNSLYPESCWSKENIDTYNKKPLYLNGWNESILNGLNNYENVPIKCFGILTNNIFLDSTIDDYNTQLNSLIKIKELIKTNTSRDIPIVQFDTNDKNTLIITEIN